MIIYELFWKKEETTIAIAVPLVSLNEMECYKVALSCMINHSLWQMSLVCQMENIPRSAWLKAIVWISPIVTLT